MVGTRVNNNKTRQYDNADQYDEMKEEVGVGQVALSTQTADPNINPLTGKPYSRRGRREAGIREVTPLQQFRRWDDHLTTNTIRDSAYAYYLRPDGATVADILVICPNGGTPTIEGDARARRRKRLIGSNAGYFRDRQQAKGFIYIGQQLTREGILKMVEIMEENQPDEILWVDEQIAMAQVTLRTDPRHDHQNLAQERISRLNAVRERLTTKLDVDAIVKEMNLIAEAQRLANLPPEILAVMRQMRDDAENNALARMIEIMSPKSGGVVDAAKAFEASTSFDDE
ncbi:MAG: hypothetical protein E6Q97_04685 [Desulfurellales bacterium]|nr:MAG: hypothetical protein E6Q97_04685 [Desulfurellales bacterium]